MVHHVETHEEVPSPRSSSRARAPPFRCLATVSLGHYKRPNPRSPTRSDVAAPHNFHVFVSAGLTTEGLYRVSGNKTDQDNIQKLFDQGATRLHTHTHTHTRGNVNLSVFTYGMCCNSHGRQKPPTLSGPGRKARGRFFALVNHFT